MHHIFIIVNYFTKLIYNFFTILSFQCSPDSGLGIRNLILTLAHQIVYTLQGLASFWYRHFCLKRHTIHSPLCSKLFTDRCYICVYLDLGSHIDTKISFGIVPQEKPICSFTTRRIEIQNCVFVVGQQSLELS